MRVLCTIHAVPDEAAEEGITNLAFAMNLFLDLVVDEKNKVATSLTPDIDVLAGLDVTLGTEYESPTIPPGSRGRGIEPIKSTVAGRPVFHRQGCFTEILELRVIRRVHVVHAGEVDCRVG